MICDDFGVSWLVVGLRLVYGRISGNFGFRAKFSCLGWVFGFCGFSVLVLLPSCSVIKFGVFFCFPGGLCGFS